MEVITKSNKMGIKKRIATPPQSRVSKSNSLCVDASSLYIIAQGFASFAQKNILQVICFCLCLDQFGRNSFYDNFAIVNYGNLRTESLGFIEVVGSVHNGGAF